MYYILGYDPQIDAFPETGSEERTTQKPNPVDNLLLGLFRRRQKKETMVVGSRENGGSQWSEPLNKVKNTRSFKFSRMLTSVEKVCPRNE